jgi:hypothetical protein
MMDISTTLITAGILAAKTALLAILAALLGLSAGVLGVVMVYRFLHRHQVAVEHESNDENVIDLDEVDIHEVDGDAIEVQGIISNASITEDADFILQCSHCGQEWQATELVDAGTYVSGGWFWGCPVCLEYNKQD